MAVVLANGYAGTLFSFMSVKKLEPAINSLDDLARSKETQLIIPPYKDLFGQFLVCLFQPIIRKKSY